MNGEKKTYKDFAAMGEALKNNEREKLRQEIADKRIDIENFRGFLSWTQIPNLSGILKAGFQSPESHDRRTWKFAGRIYPRGGAIGKLWFTIYTPKAHSFRQKEIPWYPAGQVAILIDEELDPAELDKLEAEAIQHVIQNIALRSGLEFTTDGPIDPSLIRGLVLNPTITRLEDPRKKEIRTTPKAGGGTQEYTGFGSFDPDEYPDMLVRRLDRLVGTAAQKNLVPLYDHEGNMLWPQVDKKEEEKV